MLSIIEVPNDNEFLKRSRRSTSHQGTDLHGKIRSISIGFSGDRLSRGGGGGDGMIIAFTALGSRRVSKEQNLDGAVAEAARNINASAHRLTLPGPWRAARSGRRWWPNSPRAGGVLPALVWIRSCTTSIR